MNVGAVLTKQYTYAELLEELQKMFKKYEPMDTVAVVTEIREYKCEKKQTIMLAENIGL